MDEVREVKTVTPKRTVIINKYANNSSGFVWFLGFIGAIVYYFQQANVFSEFVIGFLKAFIWPAILVYQSLTRLGL